MVESGFFWDSTYLNRFRIEDSADFCLNSGMSIQPSRATTSVVLCLSEGRRSTVIHIGLLAGLLFLFSLQLALADREPNGTDPATRAAYGQQLMTNVQGSPIWIQSVDQFGSNHTGSGVLFGDNYHVLVAGHEIMDVGKQFTITLVGNGSNLYTNQGNTSVVTNVVVHPTWTNSLDHVTGIDVAVLSLANPLSGRPTTAFATTQIDDINNSLGYGIVVQPALGEMFLDGSVRGWTSRLTRYGDAFGYQSSDYGRYSFNGPDCGARPGGGWHGDSGGGVYTPDGVLVAINVSGTGGANDITGATYALRCDKFFPWAVAQLPQPTLESSAQGSNLIFTFSSMYVLQSATNAVGPFFDVTNATSPYTNSTITDPQRFFRLRSP